MAKTHTHETPMPATPGDTRPRGSDRYASVAWAGLLIAITLLAYLPAMRAGFIWDDDAHVTQNPVLRTLDGLGRIWFEPRSIPQYYPLVHTTFWIEYHLWGETAFGYHLVNIILHAANAILLWRILRRLALPGAWLAAALFALHPVHVESVAWITERKNTLSTLFYMLSLLTYLRFRPLTDDASGGSKTFAYATSIVFFAAAMLSKTITCSLPAAILVIIWYQRGHLAARDLVPLLPFFILGVALSLVTIDIERHHVGALGDEWNLSFIDRVLVAGRALCFYATKLAWPYPLSFIYTRWDINAHAWWQYLFPIAVLATFALLWVLRNRVGRGPLAAALFFAGTLLPALGFVNVYPMRYSFVADHFQYLASLGLFVLASAAATRFVSRHPHLRPASLPACAAVLSIYAVLTWDQCHSYKDQKTLWADVVARTPTAWIAHNSLGVMLIPDGRYDEALAHFAAAISSKPDYAEAHLNTAELLVLLGRDDAAEPYFQNAVRLSPTDPQMRNSYANLLSRRGRFDEATEELGQAMQMDPDFPDTYANLASVFLKQGRNAPQAVALAEHAVAMTNRQDPAALDVLASAYAATQRFPDAVRTITEAISLEQNPNTLAGMRARLSLYQHNTP